MKTLFLILVFLSIPAFAEKTTPAQILPANSCVSLDTEAWGPCVGTTIDTYTEPDRKGNESRKYSVQITKCESGYGKDRILFRVSEDQLEKCK